MAFRGGSESALVPTRSLGGPRPLLPEERHACELLGLSDEDWFTFLREADSYTRPAAYDLVPDVQANPVPLIINLVVGVALSAVSNLLAPKPRSPSQKGPPPQLKTADIQGPRRFTADSGFSSVQELAKLGEPLPLVYTHHDHLPGQGGVRVDAKLVWSQLLSLGSGQQLRLISTMGLARIPETHRPSYAGYAIGDSTLKNYTRAKIALYFRPAGGRIAEDGPERYLEGTLQRYPGPDPFVIHDDRLNADLPSLCGTRTPSTQTQFGCYAPMPNGMRYRVPYELIVVPRPRRDEEDDWDWDTTDDADRKQDKVYRGKWPHYCGIISVGGNGGNANRMTVKVGDIVRYRIQGDTEPETPSQYRPWGLTDVNAAVIDRRITADDSIRVGDLYMAGSAVVVCIKADPGPWERRKTKTYEFRCLEPGETEVFNPSSDDNPAHGFTLQRLAMATVANNRECDATEIGIKSTVWRQINGFANVNSHPGGDAVYNYGREKGSIQLGTVNRYNKRLSFFQLEFRPLGSGVDVDTWYKITNEPFCIRGNAPVPQYNYIRIDHPRGQYEFRLKPIPGAWIQRNYYPNRRIWILEAGNKRQTLIFGDILVAFEARAVQLDLDEACNTDWLVTPKAKLSGDNLRPFDAISDYKVYDNEKTSAEDDPEHEIVYVNEIIKTSKPAQYQDMLVCALRLSSTVEFSQFEQLSAWFTHGVTVERLIGENQFKPLGPGVWWSTNNLAEIAYDLLTNKLYGAGRLIGPEAVDRDGMQLAARFIHANRFSWDGVLQSRVNLREWIYEQAAYCLLDFTIIGGRFSLTPAVPYRSDFTIDPDARVKERALFTDGNIRNLKVTWLSPEERQLFRGVATWRQEYREGFAQIRTVSMRLSDALGGRDDDPEETFDMAEFATSKEQVRTFLRYALKLRALVDHLVTFEATPHGALGLRPGYHIRLVSSVIHASRWENGSITTTGTCSRILPDGAYPVFYWRPGTIGGIEATMTITAGQVSEAEMWGTFWALRKESAVSRFYKIESLSITDENFVELACSYEPVDAEGRLATIQWPAEDFVEEAS